MWDYTAMRAPASWLLLVVILAGLSPAAQSRSDGSLDIYVIDVEGGEATLFVAPTGESMLVDTGWPGFGGRDADRIATVARTAGLTHIDYLLVTHFHGDHMGGATQLAERIPVRHFVDHGPGTGLGERGRVAFDAYAALQATGVHLPVTPGDTIPLAGVTVQIIASDGAVLEAPLTGAGGGNPLCDGFTFHGPEITSRFGDSEDRRSVSAFITFGRFRTVIMGDLTWNKEHELMCPDNRLGTVDAYLVSHHGAETSGSEALVHALQPRVAIMNNGPRKGGAVETFRILAAAPGLEDLWQNHYSVAGGETHNRPDRFIANLDGGATGETTGDPPVHMNAAHGIALSAHRDGSFVVTNSRNGFSRSYGPRN
jgi:competence protein ComEC